MAQRMRRGAPDPLDVKALRENSGLAQSNVAKLLDVDISALQRWESGQTSMPGATWGYMQLLVLSKEDRDFIDRYGFILSDKDDRWITDAFDKSESRFIKGVLMAVLVNRNYEFNHPHLPSFMARFYSRIFVMADATQADLLTYAADKTPFIRGFAIARLIHKELKR